MANKALLASELIKELQIKIDKHGDKVVYSGGSSDYPAEVNCVAFNGREGTLPKDVFYIC